ncbi:MAG: hypothetical protein A2029_08310 [Chloroflexi bacterium RBG_19FT_COMBO_47_9]|nr:MAG: hypothetical protein A2029_08310 [Chloroflexi bacterium RBG_19FT_COMBO_47_9]
MRHTPKGNAGSNKYAILGINFMKKPVSIQMSWASARLISVSIIGPVIILTLSLSLARWNPPSHIQKKK